MGRWGRKRWPSRRFDRRCGGARRRPIALGRGKNPGSSSRLPFGKNLPGKISRTISDAKNLASSSPLGPHSSALRYCLARATFPDVGPCRFLPRSIPSRTTKKSSKCDERRGNRETWPADRDYWGLEMRSSSSSRERGQSSRRRRERARSARSLPRVWQVGQ
jgi:hypothetical protein